MKPPNVFRFIFDLFLEEEFHSRGTSRMLMGDKVNGQYRPLSLSTPISLPSNQESNRA
jgi:hypothetical protein